MKRKSKIILALVVGLQAAAAVQTIQAQMTEAPAGSDTSTAPSCASQPVVAHATEAPAGFDTPTLVRTPGSKTFSNGIVEPSGDTFALDQQIYETAHDVTTGLGPMYNARACVDCHQNPVSGGASQFTELRIGHHDASGKFVNPTVTINDGQPINGVVPTIGGRSIVNDRAIVPQAQEHIPATENIRALRAALVTLGDGFVEAIDDGTLERISACQLEQSGYRIHGEALKVPVLEALAPGQTQPTAPGQARIGRFGWKDQHGSLLSFVADAYLNEMGVTNRLKKADTVAIGTFGKVTEDPEDVPDDLGLADIDHFAQFIRGTKVPPRDAAIKNTAPVLAGERLFGEIGCGICHVSSITTLPAGSPINGGNFFVPAALGSKIIHPYGDYLLHDIGTGDGIVQTPLTAQETANKLRTAPLWGLRMRPRFMHDLQSLSLEDAIERHRGEAEHVRNRFLELSRTEKDQVISFLESL